MTPPLTALASAAPARTVARALSWRGFSVEDVNGRHVGTVAEVLVDRQTGELLWLLVRLRHGGRHVAVPVEGVVAGGSHVMVPHAWDVLRALEPAPADGAFTARSEKRNLAAFPALRGRVARLPDWERRRTTARVVACDGEEVRWDPPAREPHGAAAHPAGGGLAPPAAPAEPPRLAPPAAPAEPPRLASIAIVDDHEGFRTLMRATFASAKGYAVVAECPDGPTALHIALSVQPDVMVLDVVVPVLNGLDLLDQLLREPIATRFVVVSGHDAAGPLVEDALAGRGCFVPKSRGALGVLAATDRLLGRAA